jgi:hypothetical protein
VRQNDAFFNRFWLVTQKFFLLIITVSALIALWRLIIAILGRCIVSLLILLILRGSVVLLLWWSIVLIIVILLIAGLVLLTVSGLITAELSLLHENVIAVVHNVLMLLVLVVVIPERAFKGNHLALAEVPGNELRSLSKRHAGNEVALALAGLFILVLPVNGNREPDA